MHATTGTKINSLLELGRISSIWTPWECTNMFIIRTSKIIHQNILLTRAPRYGSYVGSSTRSHRCCIAWVRSSPNANSTPEKLNYIQLLREITKNFLEFLAYPRHEKAKIRNLNSNKQNAWYGTCLHPTDSILPPFGLHSRTLTSLWESLVKMQGSFPSVTM